jgi:arsenate reductase (glutaredoxin)
MNITIYHYPKCKKSRAGLEYIRSTGIEPVVINYIEEGISEATLGELLRKLKLTAFEMVRQQEDYFKDFLKHREIEQGEWIKILSEHPKLLRRPVVVSGPDAVVADPPQAINKLLTAYTK